MIKAILAGNRSEFAIYMNKNNFSDSQGYKFVWDLDSIKGLDARDLVIIKIGTWQKRKDIQLLTNYISENNILEVNG